MKYLKINYWLRKIYISKLFQKIILRENKARKLVFKTIYSTNHWNKYQQYDPNINSVSGPGSNPKTLQTNKLIKNLSNFIENHGIKSLVDAPCGDCAWVKEIFLQKNIKYTGIDIVEELIALNKKRFPKKNVIFLCDDILEMKKLPDCDFLILRDFIIHLPINNILKLINIIKQSPVKYFGINSYSSIKENKEILIGQHRKVNLFIDPFDFKNYFTKFKDCGENPNTDDNEFFIFKNI